MNQPTQTPSHLQWEDEEDELVLGKLRLYQARHRALALTGRIPDSLQLPKTTPEKMDSPSIGSQSTSPVDDDRGRRISDAYEAMPQAAGSGCGKPLPEGPHWQEFPAVIT